MFTQVKSKLKKKQSNKQKPPQKQNKTKNPTKHKSQTKKTTSTKIPCTPKTKTLQESRMSYHRGDCEETVYWNLHCKERSPELYILFVFPMLTFILVLSPPKQEFPRALMGRVGDSKRPVFPSEIFPWVFEDVFGSSCIYILCTKRRCWMEQSNSSEMLSVVTVSWVLQYFSLLTSSCWNCVSF